MGYSDLQLSDYIDHFLYHFFYQGLGIGSTLMAHIHTLAENRISPNFQLMSVSLQGYFSKGMILKSSIEKQSLDKQSLSEDKY